MSGATGPIWALVVVLALAWVLTQTGTVRLGVDFNLWVHILLVLAVLGVVFNLFVVPFLSRGRTTTTRTASDASGTVAPPGAPATGTTSQAVEQETRDRTTL